MLKFETPHVVKQNANMRHAAELSEKYDLEQIESSIATCINANAISGMCSVIFTYGDIALGDLEDTQSEVEVRCLEPRDVPLIYRYINTKLTGLGYNTNSSNREIKSNEQKHMYVLLMHIYWYDK